jgi:MarR family transcriptional regulator for hemolysin
MALQYDFSNSVGFWITSASHAIQRALNEEVRPHGITSRQCHVLGFIALYGPLAQAELADHMGIEPPTLVGILDRMERNGWITRKACPHDRRKKVVWAAPAAEPIWEKIVACAKSVRRRATQGLSPSDLALLKQLLHRVQSNLDRERSDQTRGAEEVA